MNPAQSFGFNVEKGSTSDTAKSGPYGLRSPVSIARALHVAIVTKQRIMVYGRPATTLAV